MINRREAIGGLSAFGLMAKLAEAQGGETSAPPFRIFKFDSLPVTHNASGAAGRAVPNDTIPAGEAVGVHLSTIEAGKSFGPMHKNPNHEFRMIHAGKLELLVEGKAPELAEVGDIVFAPANEMYTVRNPGDVPTTYFVLAIAPKK